MTPDPKQIGNRCQNKFFTVPVYINLHKSSYQYTYVYLVYIVKKIHYFRELFLI